MKLVSNSWIPSATRLLICLIFGNACLYVFSDRDYEERFQIRGQQKLSGEVLIIKSSATTNQSTSQNINMALKKLITAKVKTIIIPNNLRNTEANKQLNNTIPIPIFVDKQFDPTTKILKPSTFPLNVGSDGTIRSFSAVNEPENFFIQISNLLGTQIPEKDISINFRGVAETFKSISINTLIKNQIPQQDLKSKVILLELTNINERFYPTPVGDMSKTEIIANIIEDISKKRWLTSFSKQENSLYILVIVLLTILLVTLLPTSLSFPATIIFTYLNYMLLTFLFDYYYLWLPLISSTLTIVVTYLLFFQHIMNQNQQLAWRIQQEKDNALKLEELKTNFLSLFSHDLKTPLAKIHAVTDRLSSNQLSPGFSQDIVKIKSYATELDQYIKNILRISKVESEKISINLAPSDLNLIAQEAMQKTQPLLNAKSLSFSEHLDPLFLIEMDPTLIHEVILNLLQNAISYCKPNTDILISTLEKDDIVEFRVSNESTTNKTEFEKIVFQKLPDSSVKSQGSGVGLFLVNYFIELHGGSTFASCTEKGSVEIGFSLPLSSSDNKPNSHNEDQP